MATTEELQGALDRDPEAFEAGANLMVGLLVNLAVARPGMYIHPRVGEDGVVQAWCIHQDNSGYGCRYASLVEGLVHVMEAHVAGDGKNCGH